MRKVQLAAVAGACAAAVCVPAAAATAAPVSASAHRAPMTSCSMVPYFTHNSYVRTHPKQNATHLGLAYAGDRFYYKNKAKNGFFYGRDGRAGGKTGWVPAGNVQWRKICGI
ncbi:hypothetical protein [Flexivirga oryzae]|uniref:Long-subunit fatty acid transport protein n=1 Tax=Flexivirga oryzae TaxID=1794944 RepID=A0A839NCJ2_9MICO|nr:hypothetical protein [Flexivirga oryzae]MBB2894579.1 long-subunit fatty acid transport protein [Flexivirga oryzae]